MTGASRRELLVFAAALSAAVAAKLKGPFLMKDVGDLTVVEGADAMIQKFTPIKRGKDIAGYEWKIILPKCTALVGAL